MEDEELEQNETVEGNEGTGETNNNDNSQNNSDETIEQKAQKLADGMLKKKMKNMPSKEELKRFRAWEKSQKSKDGNDEDEENTNSNKTVDERTENALKENLIFRKGITDPETVEFLSWKVSKMDGDFEENLDEFLEDNPKYLKKNNKEDDQSEKKGETTGIQTRKDGTQAKSGVDAILKSRHPELFKD